MSLSVMIFAGCLVFGGIAALAARSAFRWQAMLPDLDTIRDVASVKRFTPRNTLFLFGPVSSHPACRLQRRLLKPAIPTLIREDITIIEVYGEERPLRNGEAIDWLDPSLLRHAMNADQGFSIVFVDEHGRASLRSEAPVITGDILARVAPHDAPMVLRKPATAKRNSAVLKRLKAA
jgi:hypothetical protein